MIKIIYTLIFIFILTSSCGKKGDPVFEKNKTKTINIKVIFVA